eukprot:6457213-Amphidinium_carterae.1
MQPKLGMKGGRKCVFRSPGFGGRHATKNLDKRGINKTHKENTWADEAKSHTLRTIMQPPRCFARDAFKSGPRAHDIMM